MLASWVTYSEEELTSIITKHAKEGNESAKIGLILRDQYGVPTTRLKSMRISKVMKEKGFSKEFPEDIFNLMKHAVVLHEHVKKNKRDTSALRGFELTESKIRRLAKYYQREGVIPSDWKYNIDRVKLIVK